jgi:CubicO group peptidase (beta-lactamase class C family)
MASAGRRFQRPILAASTVREMMRNQLGPAMSTPGAGSGFGYGWAVVDDPDAADTPQGPGTIRKGGVSGHSRFVDPRRT